MIQENQDAKSCELAQTAQQHLVIAQLNVPIGGSFAPAVAQQVLAAIPQYLPAVEGQVQRDCS
jgi:hypothetical protein